MPEMFPFPSFSLWGHPDETGSLGAEPYVSFRVLEDAVDHAQLIARVFRKAFAAFQVRGVSEQFAAFCCSPKVSVGIPEHGSYFRR